MRETESPSPVAEEETPAEEADDTSAVVPPTEAETGKEEDSSNKEEKSVEPMSSGPEEASVFEEKAVPQVRATKFTLGALKGLMVENRKKRMIKIGFK
jgi:hypothetical protein